MNYVENENKLIVSIEGKTFILDTTHAHQVYNLETHLNEAETPESYLEIQDKALETLEMLEKDNPVKTTDSKYLMSKGGTYYLHWDGYMTDIAVPKAFYNFIRAYNDSDNIGKHLMWLFRNPMFVNPEKFGIDIETKLHNYAKYVTDIWIDFDKHAQLIQAGMTEEFANEQSVQTQLSIDKDGLLNTFKVVTPNNVNGDYIYSEEDDRVIFKLRDGVTETKVVNPKTGELTVTYEDKRYAEQLDFLPAIQGESGDAFFSGEQLGHTVRVGKVHYLPEEDMVDCNDSHSCVKGLHLGNKDYIKMLERGNNVTARCLLNPMDYRAVSQGEHVMRVIRYLTKDMMPRKYINKYFTTTDEYIRQSEESWNALLRDTVAAYNDEIKKLESRTSFIKSL